MKLFGWKSAGSALARPVLSHGFSTWVSGDWPRSYEAQLRELYLANAVAQRAVRLVAEGVASAPLTTSDPTALALVTATSGGQSLLETVAMQLLLHGNAYVELLAGANGAPAELFALRPERVSVEPDVRGWPMGFLYRVGANTTRLAADRVIHIRTHHPLDDHYGLGCLDAAAGAMAAHNAATRWNKALLDNAARPSGALVADANETLTADQFVRLRREMEESFAGAANAGRPMLLEGGLKWQAMSLSPADMDFAGLKAAAAREIALAFGVPPVLLGLPGDATYANYREANKALWRQAILPLAGKILDALAQGLGPWFAGLKLAVDLDQVPALSEDRERLWQQLTAADFITVNEKRTMIGLEPLRPAADMPEVPDEGGKMETKFNPWHDPKDGQFTFGPAGAGVASGTERSAPANQARPPARPPARPGSFEPNPRTRIGNNGGPPLNDPMKIEQIFPKMLIAPAGAMIAVVDDFFDLTGPARRMSAKSAAIETRRLISQIREIDPDYRFQSLGVPTTIEGQMREIRSLRMARALAMYRMRGDIEPLQIETLRFVQDRVDKAYDEGVARADARALYVRLSRNEAIGNFIDARVRGELRAFHQENGIVLERGQPVQVNRRAYDTPNARFSIPDSRVGNVAFDVSLEQKTIQKEQIMQFFRSDVPTDVVVIVRPRQLGRGSTYAIAKPKGSK